MASLAHPPLAFNERGAPVSTLYGDVFRSNDGALAESQAVFVDGCALTEQFQRARRTCVLEIGFGFGLNLLATAKTFTAVASPPSKLSFISIEAHPLSEADLRSGHRAFGVHTEPVLVELVSQWPAATPGIHRLTLDRGRITLLLVFGYAARMLPRLRLRADAIYLDGFSPSSNPTAWESGVLRQLARLAAPGARLSTYSSATAVRDGLTQVGFEVRRIAGFGRKRDRIEAHYAPRWRTWAPPPAAPDWSDRHAAVIGAGLAGVTVAARLASVGWRVTLIDRRETPGLEGSGQPLIADHLHLSPDDNLLARLTRAALALRQPGSAAGARTIGRLSLASSLEEHDKQRAMLLRLEFPDSYAQFVDASAASDLAGCQLQYGGVWLPTSTVTYPTERISSPLSQAGSLISWKGACEVSAIEPDPTLGVWQVRTNHGDIVSVAPVVVLCDASGQAVTPQLRSIPLRRVRGQTTWVRHPALSGLRAVLGGAAYAVPEQGRVLTGSTYDDGDSLEPALDADLSNARRLERTVGLEASSLERALDSAAVGFRWTASDRLPLIGSLPNEPAAALSRDALLKNERVPLPRFKGLFCARGFGSRGSLWSTLAAECIAASLEGDPMPLESDLIEAIDPARDLRHAMRRGGQA
jgi:tRNA 5-methylaminomethyl-2-thiouridine biosynthesis bifunctional protein